MSIPRLCGGLRVVVPPREADVDADVVGLGQGDVVDDVVGQTKGAAASTAATGSDVKSNAISIATATP